MLRIALSGLALCRLPAAILFVLSALAISAQAQQPQGQIVAQMTGGTGHTCVLTRANTVWCWGSNFSGELGLGHNDDFRLTPQLLRGFTGIRSLDAGHNHTCALMQDRTVRCWGNNGSGQLGVGNMEFQYLPDEIPGLTDVTALALGANHTCALMPDRTVQCWGANSFGQLGLGDGIERLVPTPVPGLSGVTALDAGSVHTCALLQDRTVQCWGYIPRFNTLREVFRPIEVEGLTGVASLSAGGIHTCAVLQDQTVRCVGDNSWGQLGTGNTVSSYQPTTIPGLSGVVQLAAGNFHYCARLQSGAVNCWGANGLGTLGLGDLDGRLRPTPVPALQGVTALFGAFDQTCALSATSALLCWGSSSDGQLGLGDRINRSNPTPIPGFSPPLAPSTTVISGPRVVIDQTTVTVTATVRSATGQPTGAVSFEALNNQPTVVELDRFGRASFTADRLLFGENQIDARYLGSTQHQPSSAAPFIVNIIGRPNRDPNFIGGGSVFGQTANCAPLLGTGAHPVTISYTPSELSLLPSEVSIVWRTGSEHLAVWGEMAPSTAFFGAAGRQSWTRFVFYPNRPLVRVVQRTVTRPEGNDLDSAQTIQLRLRVQNFGAVVGCSATIVGTLASD